MLIVNILIYVIGVILCTHMLHKTVFKLDGSNKHISFIDNEMSDYMICLLSWVLVIALLILYIAKELKLEKS